MAKVVNPTRALTLFCDKIGNQKEAAKVLGITQPYLSDLLRARRDVSPTILAKLGLRRAVIVIEE